MIMTRVSDRWSRPNYKHLVCASSSSLSACVVSEHQREDPLHGEKGDDPIRFSTPSSAKSSPFRGAGAVRVRSMARHRAAARGDEAATSQRLVEAALRGDARAVEECLGGAGAAAAAAADVNEVGAVVLSVRCVEIAMREEAADEVEIERRELKSDVTALFAAAHSGHIDVVRRLLKAGADVNQKLFRGYAATAAAREGHCDILEVLLKAGASQPACEDALLEASLFGEAEAVQLLISSEMVRLDSAAHAIVTASSRGFVDVVAALIKNGVDINCVDRVLLQSIKPALHANVDCTPLVAAIVSRQVSTVKFLLEAGARTDCLARLGAWSWDPITGEELRVGACLGEPYTAEWCTVEYFESSGEILRLLLRHEPHLLENPHLGRTLLCHAILCRNPNAVSALLKAGANSKFPIRTKNRYESRPIHLAARLGCADILRQLISHGTDINAKTSNGETPLMISAKAGSADCFLELIIAGADLGLVSDSGETAVQVAKTSAFSSSLIDIMTKALNAGVNLNSSNIHAFSPLHFITESGSTEPLQMILHSSTADINKPDSSGFTPLMVAAKARKTEVFRLLVMAGADISVKNSENKTLMSMLQNEDPVMRDSFEQILLKATLADIITDRMIFRALHYAAQKGDTSSIVQLLKMGWKVDSFDENGYSPLMLAAMEGKSEACQVLILQGGADCGLTNARNETALTLARISPKSNKATEGLILDQLARVCVTEGEELIKHTREGRGTPHLKNVRMLNSGVLTWGKSERRNVVCKEATAGPSLNFSKNRRNDDKDGEAAVFRVVTVGGREVHFEARSGPSVELWVRGINLIAKESASSGD
ncbi:ankyrin repeat domain-containing protein 17-like isoform X1 [Ananas comosus]|uniref:Ankyrin repeat domain-containing protein 17-like isoform X1 n=2 Tax=Ananas comosus TaxID=4615 RepID=A0A6P5ERW9_ANACO|nr:ankyrin repeat domain-containing protein 17-like isoform X1 [Ananas comosus]